MVDEVRGERAAERTERAWTRQLALSTSLLAVFAAVGALQSGALVNESLLLQVRAADVWNEYQADRQKFHLYSLAANTLLDAGAATRGAAGAEGAGSPTPASSAGAPLPPAARLAEYQAEVRKETAKQGQLQRQAKDLERASEERMERHHRFANAVALIQVAIALASVALLLARRPLWWLSLAAGAAGVVYFALGWLGR